MPDIMVVEWEDGTGRSRISCGFVMDRTQDEIVLAGCIEAANTAENVWSRVQTISTVAIIAERKLAAMVAA